MEESEPALPWPWPLDCVIIAAPPLLAPFAILLLAFDEDKRELVEDPEIKPLFPFELLLWLLESSSITAEKLGLDCTELNPLSHSCCIRSKHRGRWAGDLKKQSFRKERTLSGMSAGMGTALRGGGS